MARHSEAEMEEVWSKSPGHGVRHPAFETKDKQGWGGFRPHLEAREGVTPTMIIIGSMTSPDGINDGHGYYYASPSNHFWETLDAVFGTGKAFTTQIEIIRQSKDHDSYEKAIKDMEGLLDDYGILLCDILKSCAVKDMSNASDSGNFIRFSHPKNQNLITQYYDQEIGTAIERYGIKKVFYNGTLTKQCLLREKTDPRIKVNMVQIATPTNHISMEKRVEDWKAKFFER
jgi:G:T/U-mismatch repair DNA glycosylase